MDVRLYEAAQSILQDVLDRQATAGVLEKLNPPSNAFQAGDAVQPLPPLPADESGEAASKSGQDESRVEEESSGSQEETDGPSMGAKASRTSATTQESNMGNGHRSADQPRAHPSQRVVQKDQAGMNRAPQGPQQSGRNRRRKINPDAVVDYAANHDEL
eukprot:scaffold343554_cov49-Prasinocladus_malaysianus.AAC.1